MSIRSELKAIGTPERAKINAYFFKTGKGQYGEGDIFLGVSTPDSRKVAKKFMDLPFEKLIPSLKSKFHEERETALLVLVEKFKKGDEKERKKIYNFYLKNTKYVNNWDLVDLTADKIVGVYLIDKDKKILYKLVKSKDLWERRISIIATYHFIKNKKFSDTLKISELLLKDNHDLIHKSVGWMLREIGNRDKKTELTFLKKFYKKMPRTMLRYAIEKFPEKERKKFLEK